MTCEWTFTVSDALYKRGMVHLLSALVLFLLFITSDKGGGKCDCPRCLSVCLSVCLLARLLNNACMDVGEMLRVDRCQDMDELINF